METSYRETDKILTNLYSLSIYGSEYHDVFDIVDIFEKIS